MTFSIIIAAYNVASYIKSAIQSCLSQSGINQSEYEVIIINDGSTDGTPALINSYCDVPNVRIVHQTNVGLSETRNKGISIAKGDFVLFVDGDDFLDETALSILKPFTTNYDLIAFPMMYYYGDGKIIRKGHSLQEKNYSSFDFLREVSKNQLLNIIPAPTKCYRRSVLLEKHQRFLSRVLHEDNPFFIDTMMNFKSVYYIDSPIYYYRQNVENSITSGWTIRNFIGTIRGIQHISQKWSLNNRDVCYLVSCWFVFSDIIPYRGERDYTIVKRYFRSANTKLLLCKLFLRSRIILKQHIRLGLLIVDPLLLMRATRLISKIYKL